jgi:DNA repair protein RadA/Sms
MAKDKSIYTCNECGATSPKWLGKCPGCGAWNTLIESVAETAGAGKNRFQSLAHPAGGDAGGHRGRRRRARTPTDIEELDRVLGGGLVKGPSC